MDWFKEQKSAELQKIEAVEPGLPDVTVERKRGQRTMRLRVSLEGVTLSVPSKVPDAEVRAFLSAHKDWLKKHWEVALSKRSRLSEELIKRRGQVLLHGNWKPVLAISVGGRAVSLADMPEKAVLRTPDGRWNAAILSRALKDLAAGEAVQAAEVSI
jgi:predicted metal-dependent hydrolase